MLDEEKIEEEREDKRKLEREKMRELLKDPQFVRFCLRIVQSCGILDATFISSSENYYRHGRRSIGIEVINEIRSIDPEVAAWMLANIGKGNDDD